MEKTEIYKLVVLAKNNMIEKFIDYDRYNHRIFLYDGYNGPSIDDLSWQIDQPIKNLYRWVELVTLRAGLVYAGNIGEWSIPSTKYVMETIEKIVTRRSTS